MRAVCMFILAITMVACTHKRGETVRLYPQPGEAYIDLSPESAALRTEVEEFTHPRDGIFQMTKFFRGDMLVMTTYTSDKLSTRAFHFRGEDRFMESDEDRDGFYEHITVMGDSMYDFEMFRRSPDGTVTPIPADEYLDLKEKSFNAMLVVWQALERAEKTK